MATTLDKLVLIGLTGKAGTGKSTVMKLLSARYENTYGEAFADPLKKACSKAFGIPLEHFHEPSIKEDMNEFWGVSPRKIAQYVGTELFRNQVGNLFDSLFVESQDFWLTRLHGKLTGQLLLEEDGEYEEGDVVVIHDVRFQNEVDFIQRNGGYIINLLKLDYPITGVGIPNHASEAGCIIKNNARTFIILNDGTVEQLGEQLYEIFDAILTQKSVEATDGYED